MFIFDNGFKRHLRDRGACRYATLDFDPFLIGLYKRALPRRAYAFLKWRSPLILNT
jgi:hypothetical protein